MSSGLGFAKPVGEMMVSKMMDFYNQNVSNEVVMQPYLTVEEFIKLSSSKTLFLAVHVGSQGEYRKQRLVVANLRVRYQDRMIIQFVNPDAAPLLREKYGVFGTPTYLAIHNGKLLGRLLGRVDETRLENFILDVLKRVELEQNKDSVI